ncbi:HEAT repeat domain-containing protein [Isosphaeraceae bacterium EP7]
MTHPLRIFGLAIATLLGSSSQVHAQVEGNNPAIGRGVAFLRGRASGGMQVGESALMALALIKAEVPPGDAALGLLISKIMTRFPGGGSYDPERRGGHDIYEAGVVTLALVNHDPKAHKPLIKAVAEYLMSKQKPNGSWDYDARTAGDTSISQYAVLGLWEAENAGVDVSPEVWDRAAQWYLSVQSPIGSWNYHRDDGASPETVSMTAAGLGSLLICQRQLNLHRQFASVSNPLLIPLNPIGSGGRNLLYKPTTSNPRISQAVARGINWIGRNFFIGGDARTGMSRYYALYGVERLAALSDRKMIGSIDWYAMGERYILSAQKPDGGWTDRFGDEAESSWALLFMTKSTAKSIKAVEVRRLGAGTLLGGRGLPKDLSNLTVAGGRVVVRPMNGAVEGMLAVLEDPRATDADAALAGLVTRYRTEGPSALKPQRDRFLKLIGDRDPGVRRVAAWGLARMGEIDLAPSLISALNDPDDAVVGEARAGLQLLSRKPEGLGPPIPPTAEQRAAAVKAWGDWYRSTRPISLDDEEEQKKPQAPAAKTDARATP